MRFHGKHFWLTLVAASCILVFASAQCCDAQNVSAITTTSTGLTGPDRNTSGNNRLLIFTASMEASANRTITSVTYGGQALTAIETALAGTSIYGRVYLFYLKDAQISQATSNSFSVTWSGSTDDAMYSSVMLANVDQNNPISSSTSTSTNSSSPNPIVSPSISANSGDMIVAAVMCGNTGSYGWQNSFIEGSDQSGSTSTTSGAGRFISSSGSYAASASHSGPNRQAMVVATIKKVPTTYYVRPDGNNSNSGTGSSASQAWATVAAAATKSLSPGDVVYVHPGTYVGQVSPSVDGTSTSPIQFIADTDGAIFGTSGEVLVQATSGTHALDITSDDYLTFEGFRFQGHSSGSNTIDISGTGIVLNRCEVFDSTGPGVDLDSGSLTLINCLIHNNSGDGITQDSGTMGIWNTTVVDNGSDGIEQHAGTVTITNSIFANNNSDGLDRNSGTMIHSYNLVYGNGSSNYEGTSASTGEISQDPTFAGSSYRLQGTSPAIDAGTNAAGTVDEDIEGNSRPQGSGWDMGCYEGTGLIAHWKFDDASGTTIADSSGNGEDAAFNTWTPSWESGVRKGALQFNGSNDATTDAAFAPPETGTVAFWYQFTAAPSGFQRLLGIRDNWEFRADATGTIFADLGGQGSEGFHTPTNSANAGQWYHIAAVYNSTSQSYTLYLDGEQIASGTMTMSAQSAGVLSFGTRTGSSQRFAGRLDDLRIYNYEISAEEVTELYGLIGHWRLNENSGFVATDSSGLANDGNYWNGATPNSAGPYPGEGEVAAEFYGNTSHVGIYDIGAYNSETDEFSVATWVRFDQALADQTYQQFLIDRSHWSSKRGFSLLCDQPYSDQLIFRVFDGTTYADAGWEESGIQADQWHHVVGTYDGSTVRLYVDGELKASTSFSGNIIPYDGANLNLGYQLDGRMFDARVYNRTLSQGEINELYGLVGHWRLDETTGATAADSTGREKHGTHANNPLLGEPGRVDEAAEFDGIDQHVTIADDSEFSSQVSSGLSVTAWVNVQAYGTDGNSQTRQPIVSKGTTGGYEWALYATDSQQAQFNSWNGSGSDRGVAGGGSIPTNRWVHVAATYLDGEFVKVYVDGVEVGSSTSFSNSAYDGNHPVVIGARADGQYLNAIIDDVKIYNRPLSDEEVVAIHGAGKPRGVRILKWLEVK